MKETIITMPVIALRGVTVLPKMMLHFDINREKSIAAVEKAMVSDQKVFLVTQKNPDDMDPGEDQLYSIGTIALIKQLVKMPGKVIRVMAEGLERAEMLCLDSEEPFLLAEVSSCLKESEHLDCITQEAMIRVVRETLEEYGEEHPKVAKELLPNILMIQDLEELMLQTGIQLPWEYNFARNFWKQI